MTIIDDLIPGASLVTWEVEPGVYQVLHDGVRSLDGHGFSSDSSVLAPHGEPIRVFEPDHFYSVGVDFTGTPPAEGFGGRQTDFEVGPDGLLHAGDPSGLYWLRGERWIEDPDFGDRHVRAIEVGSDGAIWVLWCRGGLRNNECIGQRLHRSGADGWERIDLPDDPDLALFLRAENRMALDAEGGLWLAIEGAGLLHQDGNEWSVVDPVGRATHDFGGWSDGQVDVGGDGSLWAYFLGPEDSGEGTRRSGAHRDRARAPPATARG